MKRISRYIIEEFWPSFLVSFIFVLFLLSLGSLFQFVDLLVKNFLATSILLRYWFLVLLSLLPYGLALSTLIASTLTFGRFSQDREILAIKSLGIPLEKVLIPLLTLGFFLSLVNLVFLSFLQPYGLYQKRVLTIDAKVLSVTNLFRPGTVVTEFPGTVIFIPDKESKEKVLLYQREGEIVRTISAEKIKGLIYQGKVYVQFENGIMQTYQPRRVETYQKLTFRKYLFPLPQSERKTQLPAPKIYEMDVLHLLNLGTREAKAEQMRRLSFAPAPFLFLLIGLPLGVALPRSLWGILASCGLVLSYYFFLSGLEALARSAPHLSGLFFLPDIMILFLALSFFPKLR